MSRLVTSIAVRTLQRFGLGSTPDAGATVLGSLPVGQIESGHTLLAASDRFACGGIQLVTNAIVPVVDLPTTTAPIIVYNNAPDGGRCLVMQNVGVAFASGTAGAGGFTVFGGVPPGVLATPLTANGTGIRVAKTKGTGSSVAFIDVAKTIITGTAWELFDGILTTGITVLGVGKGIPLHGRFVVPPRYCFAFGVLADLGSTAKFLLTASWGEQETDLAA